VGRLVGRRVRFIFSYAICDGTGWVKGGEVLREGEQSPELMTEHRNETQYRKPLFINGV